MSASVMPYICLALGLASALVGGVFQAFSDFVMRGLLGAAPAAGIETMQHINRTVMKSGFLTTFIALAPATIVLAVYAVLRLEGQVRALLIAAAILYVVAVFLVTIAGNVPMNERLDAMVHTSTEAADYWQTYGKVWTRWNHVRTLGSILTAACLVLAAQGMD